MTVEPPAGPPELEAARLLLSRMGIDPKDLVETATERPPVPTFEDYIPAVARALTKESARVYGTYWKQILLRWGQRHLDEVTASDIQAMLEYIKANALERRTSRGGRSAGKPSSLLFGVFTRTLRKTS